MMNDFLTDAFVRLRQKLKGISVRVLLDPDGAEDVLQESFVRLWRKQYPLQSEQEAASLLVRTVRNASLNERRRRHPFPLEADIAEAPPDADDKEEAYAAMHRKIESELTETQRYILEEKEYGGRTLGRCPAAGTALQPENRYPVHPPEGHKRPALQFQERDAFACRPDGRPRVRRTAGRAGLPVPGPGADVPPGPGPLGVFLGRRRGRPGHPSLRRVVPPIQGSGTRRVRPLFLRRGFYRQRADHGVCGCLAGGLFCGRNAR